VTVDYATTDGTASAGSEYESTSDTLSFAPGETTKTITVPIIDNATAGPASKKFTVTLSNPHTTTPGAQTQLKGLPATVTIFDDDGAGTIDLSSSTYSVVEGAGVATITVNRFSASNLVETVDYATSDGSAAAGSDYTDTHGTLTFATGEMSKTFQVPVDDDPSFEGDETLQVTLSSPKNVTTAEQPVLGSNTPGTLTIVDDDVPTFHFSDATPDFFENVGNATITVNRGGDTSIPATVHYATSDGTAIAGTDYTATSGDLSFAAGQTSREFTVPVADDSTGGEPNRTVNLTLTQGTDTVDTAVLSILDDDPGTPSAQLSSATYSADESAGNASVTVTLNHAAAGDVSVNIATGDAADDATAGSDYTAVNQAVTIHAGDTSKVVPIAIANDSDPEDDETFTVKLSSPSGVVIGAPATATVTILDDDSAGTLDFTSLRYDASESSRHATITVRRVGGAVGTASVDYATSDGSAHAPADYAAASGTLTFGDGETSKTIEVPVAWDGLPEGDETVSINLSNFVSDDPDDTTRAAVIHIADDGASAPVQFSAGSYDVSEAAGVATITVNRSGGGLGGPVTVDYATADGTAHAGSDYSERHGTLTFGPGDSSATFQVPVVNDNVRQGGRTVNLTLSNPSGGTSLGSQATAALSIGDDEPASSPSGDRTAPKLKLTAKKLQKALTAKRLVLKVRSNESAKLSITANLRKGKKLVRVGTGSKRVGAGKTVTITLKLSNKALSKLSKSLVKGRAKITLKITGTDAAGNKATVRRTITIK
jgi:hypothetical protein